jgi:hypothetical protein
MNKILIKICMIYIKYNYRMFKLRTLDLLYRLINKPIRDYFLTRAERSLGKATSLELDPYSLYANQTRHALYISDSDFNRNISSWIQDKFGDNIIKAIKRI